MSSLTTPEGIVDAITEQSIVYNDLAPMFIESFRFYDRSLQEWSAAIKIVVPKNPKPQDIQDIFGQLTYAIGLTAHYKAISSSLHLAITNGSNLQKSELIEKLVNDYAAGSARRPAKDVLEHMAESMMKDVINGGLVSKIVKDFWSQKYESLIEIRKCVEQLSLSMVTEMKYLQGNTNGYG